LLGGCTPLPWGVKFLALPCSPTPSGKRGPSPRQGAQACARVPLAAAARTRGFPPTPLLFWPPRQAQVTREEQEAFMSGLYARCQETRQKTRAELAERYLRPLARSPSPPRAAGARKKAPTAAGDAPAAGG
jgi:hypothetical protein